MNRLVIRGSWAGDGGRCCCDCRGLFGPVENYNTLTLSHVILDLGEVEVPETPGADRAIEFVSSYNPPTGLVEDYLIRPILTPSGGTPRAAQAIDYRSLECQVYTRRQLLNYLQSYRAVPKCYPRWPYGVVFGQMGWVGAGGDILGILPECYTLDVVADELHVYSLGSDNFFLKDHWPRSIPGEDRYAPGSAYVHATRTWLPDDWLLVVFDGDVAIDPPNSAWFEDFMGYRYEDFSGDIYWHGGADGTGATSPPLPIFRFEGQWYCRMVRVEPMGPWLTINGTNITDLTKRIAFTTATVDKCLWIDDGWRAAITYSTASAIGGAIFETYPTESPDDPTENLVWLHNLPWDEHPATKRLPWLFFGSDEPFRDSTGATFDAFGGGYDSTQYSVIRPFPTYPPDYLADNDLEQPRGSSGYQLAVTENDWYNCRRQCELFDGFTGHLYAPDGSEVESFPFRRLTVEDLEQFQDVFFDGSPNSLQSRIKTDYRLVPFSFLSVGYSQPPYQLVARSRGFEAWIGESANGGIWIVGPDNVSVSTQGAVGTCAYRYFISNLWPNEADGGLRSNVLLAVPFPALYQSETFHECNSFHLTIGVVGTEATIVHGAFPANQYTEGVSVLCAAAFVQDGMIETPAAPAIMAETYAVVIGLLSSPTTTHQRAGESSDEFVLSEVDGADRWLHLAGGIVAGAAYIRGLGDGDHTLFIPYNTTDYDHRYTITNVCTGDYIQRTTNPVTFTIAGCSVNITIEYFPKNTLIEVEDGAGVAELCPVIYDEADPCAGYGFSASGAAMDAPPRSEWPTDSVIDADLFVTNERHASDSRLLMQMVPTDISAVVAVARSGLLAGWTIANHLHVPLYTYSDDVGVASLGAGFRMSDRPTAPLAKLLVVDDTVHSGRQMQRAVAAVRREFPGSHVLSAAVYAHPRSRHVVDFCVAQLSGHHYLEWNWQNAGHGEKCAYDFDGILCEDCPPDDNDAGSRYLRFLQTAKPLYLPRRAVVPLIVTGRHERWRAETVAWLDRHGVQFERLVMRDFEATDWIEDVSRFKASHYTASDCKLFAESESDQAKRIAQLSGRPVLCPVLGRVLKVPRAPDPARVGRRCLHLGRRVEKRSDCPTGYGCRHECDRGHVAIPGGTCQTCPDFDDDGPFR